MFIEGEKTWWEPPKVRSLLSDEQELRYDKCRWMEPSEQRKEKRGEEIAFVFSNCKQMGLPGVQGWFRGRASIV